MERDPELNPYRARIGPLSVAAGAGSGRVDLMMLAERVRLDPVETDALISVLGKAKRRAAPGRKDQ